MDTSNSKMYIDNLGAKTYKNSKGEFHRFDAPAVEYLNGDKWWYKEGKLHRDDGPAIEKVNGNKWWYKKGMYHRTYGPAIEFINGEKYWYILRKPLEEKEFNSWMIRIQKCIQINLEIKYIKIQMSNVIE